MASLFQHAKWRLEVASYDLVRVLMKPFSFDRISDFGGWLLVKIGPKTSKQNIVLTGLRLAFPDASDDQIQDWAARQWRNTGRTFAEFPILDRIKVFDENSRVKVLGLEHIKPLKKAKTGAVLVTGHFANWEVIAAAISQAGVPVNVTYRKTNNPYFDARVRAQRQKYGVKLLVAKSGAKGAKQLITALRSGQSIAIMNDQKFNEGISVPFFSAPAMTAPGPTRLSLHENAPLIPMVARRVNGSHFEVEFFAPLPLAKTGNRKTDIENGVKVITGFIEDRIRETPEDWFWVHRRWDKSLYKR